MPCRGRGEPQRTAEERMVREADAKVSWTNVTRGTSNVGVTLRSRQRLPLNERHQHEVLPVPRLEQPRRSALLWRSVPAAELCLNPAASSASDALLLLFTNNQWDKRRLRPRRADATDLGSTSSAAAAAVRDVTASDNVVKALPLQQRHPFLRILLPAQQRTGHLSSMGSTTGFFSRAVASTLKYRMAGVGSLGVGRVSACSLRHVVTSSPTLPRTFAISSSLLLASMSGHPRHKPLGSADSQSPSLAAQRFLSTSSQPHYAPASPSSSFSSTLSGSSSTFSDSSSTAQHRLSLISRHLHTSPSTLAINTPYSTERISTSEAEFEQKIPQEPSSKKSGTMSKQAAHPTVLIPGPIEYSDEVLASMSHFRYALRLTFIESTP